jgi:hypothetical protein
MWFVHLVRALITKALTYFFSLKALLLPPLILGPYIKKRSFFFNLDPPTRATRGERFGTRD